MSGLRNNAGKNNPFFGRKHTEETRRRMSEAHKGKRNSSTATGGYNLLIAAIVKQAVKDRDASFFESETGINYCAVAGFNPVKLGMAAE